MQDQNDPVTRILFVRHGQSDFNEQARFQGSLNEPRLTAKGKAAAVLCGLYLSSTRFDAVFSSPLERTKQTAQEIEAAFLHAGKEAPPLIFDDRLREVHLPGWEGLSLKAVREQRPVQYGIWKASPHLLQLPTTSQGEGAVTEPFSPLQELFARSRQFWDDTLSWRHGQTILVVGHGMAIQVLLSVALGFSASKSPRLQQSNGGISAITFTRRASPAPQLEFMNRTQHLGESLPKMKEGRRGVRVLLLTQPCADRIRWPDLLKGGALRSLGMKDPMKLVAEDFHPIEHGQFQTVVWIRPEGHLRRKDMACLGLEAWPPPGLRIEADRITALHYTRFGETPVLQALNVDSTLGRSLDL